MNHSVSPDMTLAKYSKSSSFLQKLKDSFFGLCQRRRTRIASEREFRMPTNYSFEREEELCTEDKFSCKSYDEIWAENTYTETVSCIRKTKLKEFS